MTIRGLAIRLLDLPDRGLNPNESAGDVAYVFWNSAAGVEALWAAVVGSWIDLSRIVVAALRSSSIRPI